MADGKKLMLVSSYPQEGVIYESYAGREILLLDSQGQLIWQIEPEAGETNTISGIFERGVMSNSMFIGFDIDDAKLMATRFNGDVFLVDLTSGYASFDHWERT